MKKKEIILRAAQFTLQMLGSPAVDLTRENLCFETLELLEDICENGPTRNWFWVSFCLKHLPEHPWTINVDFPDNLQIVRVNVQVSRVESLPNITPGQATSLAEFFILVSRFARSLENYVNLLGPAED